MLPINLLPNYIFDKNKKRNAFIIYALAVAAVAGCFIVWSQGVQHNLDQAKAELADATTKQSTYNAKVQEIQKVQGQIADIKTKQTFIANAQTYNDEWPKTYDLMRNLTSKDILLKSMTLDPKDHKTMQITAFAPGEPNTEAEFKIARWWKSLAARPNLIEHVDMQVPGHPFVGSGTTAANGLGGAPSSGGFGGSGGPMAMGMMGAGGPRGIGAMGSPGSGGFPGSGGSPGAAGGAAGGGAVGPAEIEGRPGVNFNATVVFKTPLAPGIPQAPVWPAGGAAAGGGAPGPMGMMPGSAGMMAGSGGPGVPGGRE